MFWLLFWLLSLFIFLVFPAVCVEENRRRWIRRFRECRWNVDQRPNVADEAAQASTTTGDRFHFVLSKAQEDEIREHFLIEQLKNYTQQVAEEDIVRPRVNSNGAIFDASEPSDNQDEPVTATEETSPITDLEQGVMAIPTKEAPGLADSVPEPKASKDSDVTESEVEKEEELQNDVESGLVSNVVPETTQIPNLPVTTSSGESSSPVILEMGDVVDDVSDSGTSDGEMMDVHSFDGDCDGTICLPVAGECRPDALPENIQGKTRTEPNGCAVCLSHFEVADKVTWSSNPACQHVFHDDCIKDWLMASGRKHLKRQRREQRRTGNLSYDSDPVAKITGFPMLCPCCRQPFVMPEEDDDSIDEKAVSPEQTGAGVGGTEALMIATS